MEKQYEFKIYENSYYIYIKLENAEFVKKEEIIYNWNFMLKARLARARQRLIKREEAFLKCFK